MDAQGPSLPVVPANCRSARTQSATARARQACLGTACAATRESLAQNTGTTLTLALSYGGRTELVDAVRGIAEKARDGEIDPAKISEQTISGHLYTSDMPDPDLLIRTSGEMRVSNFLLWQISYAELVVTDRLWPDFGEPEFCAAMEEFAGRNRRFGKV